MKTVSFLVLCVALFLPTVYAQQRQFTSSKHDISASIPQGWDQVQGIGKNTVLKLARSGKAGQKARIAIMLQDIPRDRDVSGFDIWSLSNDDIRKAAEGTSILGEPVTLIDWGRASVDNVHVVWNKSRRTIPDGSQGWEFVYEGFRGSQSLTIRLTSIGNEPWYNENQVIFAEFIRSLRLPIVRTPKR